MEAAIARAKARKAEQQAAPVDAPAAEPVDPRKAAVEAAIARAKARKAEQQAAPVDAPTAEPVDPAQGGGGSRHRPRQSAQSRTAGRTTGSRVSRSQ